MRVCVCVCIVSVRHDRIVRNTHMCVRVCSCVFMSVFMCVSMCVLMWGVAACVLRVRCCVCAACVLRACPCACPSEVWLCMWGVCDACVLRVCCVCAGVCVSVFMCVHRTKPQTMWVCSCVQVGVQIMWVCSCLCVFMSSSVRTESNHALLILCLSRPLPRPLSPAPAPPTPPLHEKRNQTRSSKRADDHRYYSLSHTHKHLHEWLNQTISSKHWRRPAESPGSIGVV